MSRASGSVDLIGSIAVLPDGLPARILLCDKVYRLHLDRTRMTPHFVAFLLRSRQVREQVKLGISGAEGMANNLPTAVVTNLPLPDAPITEQARVVTDLNDAWDTIQEATQLLKRQLAILWERRQALITAAVTGQIDVTSARGLASAGGADV
jgi:type I restriction enzyme, S subunit